MLSNLSASLFTLKSTYTKVCFSVHDFFFKKVTLTWQSVVVAELPKANFNKIILCVYCLLLRIPYLRKNAKFNQRSTNSFIF